MRRLRSAGTVTSVNPSSSVSVLEQLVDMLRGIQADVSQVIVEWNSTAYPIFSTLPQGKEDTRWNLRDDTINAKVNGIDGANIFVDNSATALTNGGRYWRSDIARPRTIKETLEAVFTEMSDDVDAVRTEVAATASSGGVSASAQAAIGAGIFDTSAASATGSLDDLTETNRANLLQIAKDVYDDLYDNLTGDGVAAIDNFSVRQMMQALLLLHGGAWNSSVTLSHSSIGASIGAAYRTFAGGTNEETALTSEQVVGGFTFDPSELGTAISSMVLYFEGLLTYIAAGAAGSGSLLLYDMGAPGSIGAGTLRSTLNTAAVRNTLTQERNTLSSVAAPSDAGEIFNVERVYELRILTDGNGNAADIIRMAWGGIYIEVQ